MPSPIQPLAVAGTAVVVAAVTAVSPLLLLMLPHTPLKPYPVHFPVEAVVCYVLVYPGKTDAWIHRASPSPLAFALPDSLLTPS